jgi:hypothetical protein
MQVALAAVKETRAAALFEKELSLAIGAASAVIARSVSDEAIQSCFVIPGCAVRRRPGIHTHGCGYGFSDVQLHIKARSFHSRPGMTT